MIKSTTKSWGLLFSLLLVSTYGTLAQSSSVELRNNRSVLRYFNGNEIASLQNQSPEMYQVIADYFTNSFTVQLIDEEAVEINFDQFYNLDLFNVVEFEHLREPTENITFVFKEKYLVSLRSEEWLANELNGLSKEEVLQLRVPRSLPAWVSSGNLDEDYAVYKRELENWIRDFHDKYREITSQNLVPKIRISEWKELSQDKKQYYFNLPNGYLIVD